MWGPARTESECPAAHVETRLFFFKSELRSFLVTHHHLACLFTFKFILQRSFLQQQQEQLYNPTCPTSRTVMATRRGEKMFTLDLAEAPP